MVLRVRERGGNQRGAEKKSADFSPHSQHEINSHFIVAASLEWSMLKKNPPNFILFHLLLSSIGVLAITSFHPIWTKFPLTQGIVLAIFLKKNGPIFKGN